MAGEEGFNGRDRELLVRVDERTAIMEKQIGDLEKEKVSIHEFAPVKAIVFGLVGAILIAIIGAIMTLLLK